MKRKHMPFAGRIMQWSIIRLLLPLQVAHLAGCGGLFGSPAPDAEAPDRSVTRRLAAARVQPARRAAAASQPVGRPARRVSAGPAVAFLNDQPIAREDLVRLLVEARGLQALQLLLQREAVYQEARRLGVSVTQADVEREYRMTCEAAQFNGKQPEALTPARREKIIEEWTRSRGVPREELAVMVERQACLRKMAKAQIKITEEMLRDEYRRTYGEKVEVRHIQLAAERDFLQIRRRLARGDRFEDLVADYSRNNLSRERRGLLPPFSADDPGVPAIFAKVAFQLKPGEVSNPIEAEGSFHVLKLERRIPAQAVEFGEVKDALTHTLEARLLARQIEALGKRLYSRARLRITDPVLREQYKRRLTKGWIEGPPLTGP